MACVYCNSTNELTEEHIFPDALGGRATVAEMVCRGCNNRFPHEFEQEFVKGFFLIRFLLRVPSRRGGIETIPAEVVIDGAARTATVSRSGGIAVPTLKVEEAESNGEARIIYRIFSREAADTLCHAATTRGWNLNQGRALLREIQAVVNVDLRFITSLEAHRTVAKIAYTGFAARAGRHVAESHDFTTVRNFIARGEGPSPTRLFLNHNVADRFQLGPHHHAIVLACDGQTHIAHAMVVIFGGLFYLVELTSQCVVNVFQSYGYNSQTGNEDPVIVAQSDNERLMVQDILWGNTVWNDYGQSLNSSFPIGVTHSVLKSAPKEMREWSTRDDILRREQRFPSCGEIRCC